MQTIYQNFVIKNDNNVFDAKSNVYKVFLNSVELKKDIDYTVVDSKSFSLINYNIGDKLKIESMVSKKIIGYDNSCIFNIFEKVGILRASCQYLLTLNVSNTVIEQPFKSQLSPLYSSVRNVENLIKPVIEKVDIDIEEMLFLNSRELENILIEKQIYSTIKLPKKDRWVLYKTCLEILYKVYYQSNINDEETTKTVGTLTMKDKKHIIELKDFITRFENLYSEANLLLLDSNASSVASFVKAKSSAYPVKSRLW